MSSPVTKSTGLSSRKSSYAPSNHGSRAVRSAHIKDDDNIKPRTLLVSSSIPLPDRKTAHFTSLESAMADPFEVRMRFTSQLQHLNASVTSSQKAAQYALKYKDMDEDLHSCILEQLEKNSMNNRANILYFLEALADLSSSTSHPDYIRMMQRDILRIVDAVAPEDGSGAANIKVVQKVLSNFATKRYLSRQTVDEIDELLRERDTGEGGTSPAQAARDVEMDGWEDRRAEAVPMRLERKLVEQRIEEDRERHKRLRESQWAVPNAGVGEEEFEMLWEETSSVGSDDWRAVEEEEAERRRCAVQNAEEFEGTAEA